MGQQYHPHFIPDKEDKPDNKYTTKLSDSEESKFLLWAHDNKLTDIDHPDSHYDYRGYWKETGGKAHPPGNEEHFPDTYKQPGHPTFSKESKYAAGRNDAGTWEGDTFVPAKKLDYDPRFTPDEETPPEKPGILKSFIDTVFKEPEFLKPSFQRAKEKFEKYNAPTSDINAELAKLGYPVESTPPMGDIIESQATPGDIALMVGTGGEGLIPKLSRGLAKTAAGLLATRGAGKMYGAESAPEFAAGALETGMGALGFHHPITWHGGAPEAAKPAQKLLPPATRFHAAPEGIYDVETTPLRRSREIPYRYPEAPPPEADKFANYIRDESGRIIAPPQENLAPLRPSGPWDSNIGSGITESINPEDHLMDLVRNKFNMAQPMPEIRPSAAFKGWQETGFDDMPDFPLYDIHAPGHELHGSTVDPKTLEKEGIDIPETPPNPRTGEPFRRPFDDSEFIPEEDQSAGGIYPTKNQDALDEFVKGINKDVETQDLDRMLNVPEKAPDEPMFSRVLGFDPLRKKVNDLKSVTDKMQAQDNFRQLERQLFSAQASGKNVDELQTLRDTARTHYYDLIKEKPSTPAPKTTEKPFMPKMPAGKLGKADIPLAKDRAAWDEAIRDAKTLGIDHTQYDNLDALKWAVTKKTAQETIRTGKNPLATKPEEPLFSKTSSGKLKMSIENPRPVIQILKKFYEGDPSTIATKELIQNSIDEIAAAHPKGDGRINVNIDDASRSITVDDNGRGMTKEQIETVYTNLGDTGKHADETVGGFGVAKAGIQLGGKEVEVETIAFNPKTKKLEKTSYKTTPEELLDGKTDYSTVEVPEGTPTGTKVKVTFDEKAHFYHARDFVNSLTKYSESKGIISHNADFMGMKEHPFAPQGLSKKLGVVETPYANMTVSVPKDAKIVEEPQIKLILNNRGMFQGVSSYPLNNTLKVPDRIVVDVSSKVDALHDDYPFSPSRERLKYNAASDIGKLIEEHIINPQINRRKDELRKAYEGMQEITVGKGPFPKNFGRKVAIYDPKGQLTKGELESITSNPKFQDLAHHVVSTIDDVLLRTENDKWAARLDKSGILFGDIGEYGVTIPHPDTRKAAILINPLFSMSKYENADEAVQSIIHTIQHEIAHLEESHGPAHGASWLDRMGKVIEKHGWKAENESKQKLFNIIADEQGNYHPEIQEVLQRYTESRGREASQTDYLSGTGFSSKTSDEGSKGIPRTSKSNGERVPPLQQTVNKLFGAIEEAKGLREEQEQIYKIERAKRFADFESVPATGLKGAKQSLGKLRGEFDKVEGVSLGLNDKETDSLFNAVKFANVTTGEKARGYTALLKILEGGEVPQRGELAILDNVFGSGFSDKIIEMHGGLGAARIKLVKSANTMKQVMSSADVSAPLRQGVGLIHKKEWWNTLPEMFKYMKDENYYKTAMTALERRPSYILGREAGLFLAKPGELLNSEEAFASSYISHLASGPKGLYIKDIVMGSERAYTGFLNKLRADVFDNLLKDAKAMGHEAFTIADKKMVGGSVKQIIVPSKSTEQLAKFINVATGRGGLGRLEKMAPELNAVFWSPRLISSRLTVLNPKYYHQMDKFTRWEAIKSLFFITTAGTTMATLGYLNGGKVSLNPLSADFGKIRFGQHVLDPWAGFQQPVVAAARFLSGRTEVGPQNQFTTVGNFTVNKLSPITGLAYDLSTAQGFTKQTQKGSLSDLQMPEAGGYIDRYGNKKFVSAEIRNRFVPIFVQDVIDLAKSDISFAEMIGFTVPSALGVGVQDYPERRANRSRRFRRMRMTP